MTCCDPRIEAALRLVVRTAARGLTRGRIEGRGGPDDPPGIDVREAEGTNPRCVDDPGRGLVRAVAGDPKGDGRRGRVPPAAGDGVDPTDRPQGIRDEGVDQRRLAHTAVSYQDRRPPPE